MQPTPIVTPTPSPAELVRDATQIIGIWNSLGPLMAVLGIVALAFAAILLIQWSNRNSSSTAIQVLAAANTQKEKELAKAEEQRDQDRKQYVESLTVLSEQSTRANDIGADTNKILRAMNEGGLERAMMQKQLSDDFHTLISTGSAPVQEIRNKVNEIVTIVGTIDSRTADWNAILNLITPLLIELGALRAEAKKHSTQPIPIIDPVPPANGEVNSL